MKASGTRPPPPAPSKSLNPEVNKSLPSSPNMFWARAAPPASEPTVKIATAARQEAVKPVDRGLADQRKTSSIDYASRTGRMDSMALGGAVQEGQGKAMLRYREFDATRHRSGRLPRPLLGVHPFKTLGAGPIEVAGKATQKLP